jgi:hypothetical protein
MARWWYGVTDCETEPIIFSKHDIKIPSHKAKYCCIDGLKFSCIHGPFKSEAEATERSKRHTKGNQRAFASKEISV